MIAQRYRINYLSDIDSVGDSVFISYDGTNYDINTTGISKGEACEESIMAVLWDLFDSDTETRDTIALGYQAWWDITTESNAKTFSEFIQHFYSELPDQADNLGPNLTYYKMAPGNLTCSIPSSDWDLTPPTFSWLGFGGSSYCPNNQFTLRFRNTIDDVTLPLSTTQSSLTINELVWAFCMMLPGKEVLVDVIGYQNDSPLTGGYISETITFIKPLFVTSVANEQITITNSYGCLYYGVSVPSSFGGLPVVAIAASALAYNMMTSISLPSSITTLGNSAFYHCTELETVVMNTTSIVTIPNKAFDSCPITSIKLPNTLTGIGEQSFRKTAFTTFIIPEQVANIGYKAFDECSNVTFYTEHLVKPSGWDQNWNNSSRPVVWGTNLSSDKSYVISFTKSVNNPSNATATNGISNPTRSSYTFDGWYTTSDYSGTKYSNIADAPNGTLYVKWKKACVTEGSLITLEDGTQVAVEDLTGDESLLVWNLFTGDFDTAPILFIDSEDYNQFEIIHLYFSDGTEVKVINEHAFWDFDLNKYVYITAEAGQYIGHYFNKQTIDSDGGIIWTSIQLIDVNIYTEYTTAWSPVTYGHLCFYVNGMLSMPGNTTGLVNIFNVDPNTLKIDEELFLDDVSRYGLFTYEEFSQIIEIPEIIFNAFGGQYLKVAIGKGMTSFEEIILLIQNYSAFLY
ncbi:MAG: leucine-rich repeat protein [Christensenellaceae bacterium]|nr:leucine-rich repeat protein [Christensenellaceae bacterium]